MRCHSPRPRRSCRKTREDAARAATKPRVLPKEAYAILRAYALQTSRPDKLQLAELVEKIRAIPGCEDCQAPKLHAYFKERRKTERRALMAAKFKAGRRPEPETLEIVEVEAETEADVAAASPPASSASELDSVEAPGPVDPDPPSPTPSPSTPSSHLHSPMPSFTGAPTTFAELTRWLQEQNRRWKNLKFVPL